MVVMPVRRYDPKNFKRYLLKDPELMKQFNPYQTQPIIRKVDMAHYLTDYCLSAGIAVCVDDFLFRLRKRQVEFENRHTKTPLMKQTKMVQMYKMLFFGSRSQLFLDILHSHNWWSVEESGPRQPVVSFAQATKLGQQALDLSQ